MMFLFHFILLVVSAIPGQSCVLTSGARGIWEINLPGRLLAFEFQILVNDKFPASI